MKNKFSVIFSILFYTAFFLYILLFINPELIYYHQQLGFSFDKYSLIEYLTYPGGIAECASLFLFQLNINSVSGALLYTLLTFLIVVITGKIIDSYKSAYLYYIIKYVPGVIIAGLLANYSFHLVFIFTVLLLILFFHVFINIIKKYDSFLIQIISFFILSGLTYYISGGLAFLIFSLSSMIYMLSGKEIKPVIVSIIIVISAAIIPYLAYKFVFFVTAKDAYFKLIPYYYYYEPGVLLYSLYFYLPFIILVLIMTQIIKSEDEMVTEKTGKVKALLLIQFIVILIAFLTIAYLKFQKEQRHKILVDYYSYNKQWDKLLVIVKQNPSDDRLIQFHTNRALYHTGQLSESMFNYPQIWGVDGLFLSGYLVPDILLPTTEIYIDLGHINDAIHWGNEAFSQNEHSPQILEQLVISNIIAGNYKSAQLYINAFRKFLFFGNKAGKYDQYINNENIPDINSIVKEKRNIMPVNDFVVNRKSPCFDLISLLEDNKQNKMAFEYLMAYFLLNNDLASFIEYLSFSKNFSYIVMPKVYEEALILYAFELQKRGRRLANLKISKVTVDRFTSYMNTLEIYKDNRDNARHELKNKFGNTYWYYIQYVSPVTTNKKIVIK